MSYNSTALSTSKGASDTISVNDWNVGLGDNIKTGVARAIAEATSTAAVANIDLTSLSTGFRHLKVLASLRGDNAAAQTTVSVRFNNDSGNNYYGMYLAAYGSTYTVVESLSGGLAPLGSIPAATTTGALFAALEITLLDYQSTTPYKTGTYHTLYQTSTATAEIVSVTGALSYWSASAITRITMQPGANNFVTGSRVTVYGLPY